MRPVPDGETRVLDEVESEEIFTEFIVPRLQGATPQVNPTVVVLSAQPGAGKTVLSDDLRRRFASSGGAVLVEIDSLKPFHPLYRELRAEGVAHDEPIMADCRRWLERSLDYLAAQRVNVIAEHGLRTREVFEDLVERFDQAGYRIEGALVGTPAAASRLGILARYQVAYEHSGFGRYYPEDRHDERFEHLSTVAGWFDTEPRMAAVSVHRRGDPTAVYRNERGTTGRWRQPARTVEALTMERTRIWTAAETQAFLILHNSLSDRMAERWQGPLDNARRVAAPYLDPATPTRPTRAAPALTQTPPPAEDTSIGL